MGSGKWCKRSSKVNSAVRSPLAPLCESRDWMQVTNLHIKALSPVPTLTSARGLHLGHPVLLKLWNISSQLQTCPSLSQLTPVPSHRAPMLWLPTNGFCPSLKKKSQKWNQKCAYFCVWHLLLSIVYVKFTRVLCVCLLITFYQWLLFHCKNIIVVYFFSAFG